MTELERFERLIEKSDGCWEWKGTKCFGYGKITLKRNGRHRPTFAHRVSYELYRGPIRDGLLVCHHCDNPGCVRPDHLFLGTKKDNAQDYQRKFRRVRTHCKRGHAFTEVNTYHFGGRMHCRRCNLLATWRKRGILSEKYGEIV